MDDCDNTMVAPRLQSPAHHQEPEPTSDNPSRFPTEVYERIIDFLASEILVQNPRSPSPLTSCCLTSRIWFPRSRFHLYFEPELDSRERLEELVRCLEINPSNVYYVRRLSVYPSEDQGWVSAVPLTLAPRLKGLSTLELYRLDLASVHPNFFQHLSTFSTISELELYIGRHRRLSLIRMISVFPRLQKLTFLASLPSHDEATTLAPPARWRKPLPLRHLRLNEYSAPMFLPALIASATPLTTFRFELYASSAKDVEQHLQSVGLLLSSCRTLRTIRLHLRDLNGRYIRPHLSFSSLSDLQHLLLCIPIKGVEDISAIAELLSTISAHSLQFLQLDLEFRSNREITEASELAPWGALSEALLRSNVHSTREIAISMKLGRSRTSAFKKVAFRVLPALKTMNVVDRWSEQRYDAFWSKL